jgi:hypothetical protein
VFPISGAMETLYNNQFSKIYRKKEKRKRLGED